MQHISSLSHPLVKHLVRLRQQRRYRYVERSVLVEGIKMVSEIGAARVVVATDEKLLPKGIQAEKIFVVTESVMKKISGVEHPEGVVAEVSMPDMKVDTLNKKRKILVLDGVSDPGNLGTLIRSALALGWEGAFIVDGCCDPFNEKTIRAAKGATFRLPLAMGSWQQLLPFLEKEKILPLVADMGGKSVDTFVGEKKYALVLSNEARGLSEQARKCPHKVSVPIKGEMESLNVAVAGGILMYLLIEKKDGRKTK
jgi:TrmH family RNA methyltransferase